MTTKAELLKVIRRECLNCVGGYDGEVLRCTSPNCELFPYRMGKDPNPNRVKSELMKARHERNELKPAVASGIIDEDQRELPKAYQTMRTP